MVIFLSTGMLEELSKRLIEGGYQPEAPAAIVYKATWPEQKIFRCTVGTLHDTVASNGLTKTSLIVVGNCLGIGNLLAVILDFIIVAFAMFLLVKAMNKLASLKKKEEEAPEEDPKPTSEELLTEIRTC